ncbi:hypothetical protein ACJRO7_022242 [Eucalyptus globulus]|uniref:Uncharacterized protein n=1 Tax=Eucalyptus globulus TaxID=34317 RepID=A0ABD3KML5_EUCGL
MSERSAKSRKPKPTSPPANAIPISSSNPTPQPSLLILMARKSSLLKQALILVLLLLALYALLHFLPQVPRAPAHGGVVPFRGPEPARVGEGPGPDLGPPPPRPLG